MSKLTLRELILLPMLSVIMFVSKLITEALPNIHLLATFIIVFTLVFRWKAIFTIIIFCFITAFFYGGIWWIPYLYIWPILWAVTLLLPKNMPKKTAAIVYMIVASLHGFLYGVMYAPFQAIAFGLNFKGMLSWIISGLPFDVIHGISNFLVAGLVIPLVTVFKKVICQKN